MKPPDKTLAVQYQALHASKAYGTSGNVFRLPIQVLIAELKPGSILDYGCGRTTLHEQLNVFGATYYRYDPGIPELSELPVDGADFVINTDVLEHIPEAQLDAILSHIASLSQHVFFNIATRPAKEILPNGQNAHCTIKLATEWEDVLRPYFPDVEPVVTRPEHSVLFLTWDSPLKEAVVELVEARILRKKVMKAEKTITERVRDEGARLRRRLSRTG